MSATSEKADLANKECDYGLSAVSFHIAHVPIDVDPRVNQDAAQFGREWHVIDRSGLQLQHPCRRR